MTRTEEVVLRTPVRSGIISGGLGDVRSLTHRGRVIAQILERYNDLIDPLLSGNESGSTGVLLMPATYTPTVREVERLMQTLREDRHGPLTKWTHDGEPFAASPRRLWWHLNGWYIDVQHVLHVPPLKTQKNKRKQLTRQPVDQLYGAALPQVRIVRKADVRFPIALKGVERLAELWSLTHEPMLPTDLRLKAAA